MLLVTGKAKRIYFLTGLSTVDSSLIWIMNGERNFWKAGIKLSDELSDGPEKIIYNYLMNARGAFAERHFMKCDLQDLIRIIPAKGS